MLIVGIEKIAELANQGLDFDAIVEQVRDYHNHTHILFCLESLTNLARNGRINPAVAKIAGVIGIRVCGDAKGGQITPVHKPRGAKKATAILVDMMKERGFADGMQLRIAHCFGEEQAQALADATLAQFPNTRVTIEPTTALCSFYAEAGGLMIGFEGGYNANNNNIEF
ncbi:MAG: DegV family protein [Oscillospiraceae bacterium]|nr:DegV family protein [Oscillospiraceae bacterium]